MKEKAYETTLSKRMNELMITQGIRNLDLARALYVSPTAVSGYRTGYRHPDLDKISRMAEFLDVSVAYLLGYSEDPSRIEFEVSVRDEGVLALFHALSEQNQQLTVENMTELLVQQMQNFAKSNRND